MGVNGNRKMINDNLDKIQDEMLRELKATEEKESSKLRQLINSLKQKEEEISELQDNIASIKKTPNHHQTFGKILVIADALYLVHTVTERKASPINGIDIPQKHRQAESYTIVGKNSLDYPQCLHYYRNDNKLLVANTRNDPFVSLVVELLD
ncbi:unnamed protein product [Mytilus edulis]|uniref:Uncharacterized protein n=1 Tax=Mytilus edulis TaxID=6550 RepID=A0A8S3UTR3_MYTED|nr:unnamed protein product [Mytilus edulis]